MKMTNTPPDQFYTRVSDLENNKRAININKFIKSQDNGYYELDGGIIKDIDVHNPRYNHSKDVININNISGDCYPINLHSKNGILDGTVVDLISQDYQLNKIDKNYSRLIYDKTISYMNMDLISEKLYYTSIYIECAKVSDEIEYSVLQILNIISRIDQPVDLYIKYSDNYSNSKKEISFCIFLINQIYNNKLIDKIKTINIPLYLLKLLILSSKFYKQVNYILEIENLLLEIISDKDKNIDDIDKYKLNKYNISCKNIYLYNRLPIDDDEKTNIIKYLNSFKSIGQLNIPYVDRNSNDEILNEIYKLELKCNNIKYYGDKLDVNLDIIILNSDVECYFHKDYVLELLDGNDNRLNIMFNDNNQYKLIYIDKTMDDSKYISTKIVDNIEFTFINNITDLNLII